MKGGVVQEAHSVLSIRPLRIYSLQILFRNKEV